MNKRDSSIISVERLERSIYLIRGEKVMLDEDLARLYLVRTKVLVQAVKRNSRLSSTAFVNSSTLSQKLRKSLHPRKEESGSAGRRVSTLGT